ncbi:MAG: response regulator [Rhodospirillales bacterium]|nr:response regulator [Rhodospirillales bacterium]
MAEYDFEKVRLAIGDPNRDLRAALVAILQQHGFHNVLHSANMKVIREAVEADKVDLLVCDAGLEGGNFSQMVSDIRHNRMGVNPFIVIIGLLENPTKELVHQVAGAGADDMLLKPISAGKVAERIMILTKSRKEFVVTTDYVGPDRRSGHRPGTQKIETIAVPNPVAVRATGGSLDEMEAEIQKTLSSINEQKVERHAFQIEYLVKQIVPLYQGPPDKAVLPLIKRLIDVSKDFGQRLKSTQYAHVGELCQSVNDVAVRVAKKPQAPSKKDIDLLPQLSKAIQKAFTMDVKDTQAVQDISETVKIRDHA